MKKVFFLAICSIVLCSCTSKITKVIRGLWTIDSIYYKNHEVRRCFTTNAISFDKDSVELPTVEFSCPNIIIENERWGTWNVKQTDSILLKIETKSQIFNGTYRLKFVKDQEHKLLKMVINSENVHLTCSKALFDYDANIGIINDLVNASNKE